MSTNLDRQLRELKRGAVDLIQEADLVKKIRRGKPLRVKAGFDPTAPDLHLGHTVLINKLRQFQAIRPSGDFLDRRFTGMIGDPTGKNATRPRLTAVEIAENARTYQEQIFKILDPQRTLIEFNSRWMRAMDAAGLIELAAKHTVARMLERDDLRGATRAVCPSPFMSSCIRWSRATILLHCAPMSNSEARIRNSTCWWAGSCRKRTARNRRLC